MAPTRSSDAPALDASVRRRLLQAARAAIEAGMQGRVAAPPLDRQPPALCAPAATFVTLTHAGELRGCVGTLDACRPLLVDAALNARAAAFEDPRFAPLAPPELPGLAIHVSVLRPPERLHCRSEAELIAALRPGVDGVILREGRLRGTFLPAVWASIGDAGAFLAGLKRKIGLPPDYWSDTLEVARYTVDTVA
jgi:AmmeMemoRadiSam system protein A